VIAAGLAIACLGVASGLVWRTPPGAAADLRAFELLNRPNRIPVLDALWAAVRPLGRTWFLFVVVGAGMVLGRPVWVSFVGVAALLTLLEPMLKQAVRRPRPYHHQPQAKLRLPAPPLDPSFPSGDSGRAGLLAAAVCLATPAPLWACGCAAALAALVALGRVRAGVHYPSDVWAGGWLGFGLGMAWAGVAPGVARLLT